MKSKTSESKHHLKINQFPVLRTVKYNTLLTSMVHVFQKSLECDNFLREINTFRQFLVNINEFRVVMNKREPKLAIEFVG